MFTELSFLIFFFFFPLVVLRLVGTLELSGELLKVLMSGSTSRDFGLKALVQGLPSGLLTAFWWF